MNRTRSDQADQRVQASAMPQQVPPGMFNPQFQAMYPSAVGQPATGPIAGDPTSMMPDWLKGGTPPPPDQPPALNGASVGQGVGNPWWQNYLYGGG